MMNVQAFRPVRFASNQKTPAQLAAENIRQALRAKNVPDDLLQISAWRDMIHVTYEDGHPIWNNHAGTQMPNPTPGITLDRAIALLKEIPGVQDSTAEEAQRGVNLVYLHESQRIPISLSRPMRLLGRM